MPPNNNNSFSALNLELVDYPNSESITIHNTNTKQLSKKQLKKQKRNFQPLKTQTTSEKTIDHHKDHNERNLDIQDLERVYNLPEIWLSILEFLPLTDLFMNCSVLNRYHFDLIHSINCYASILMRDFIEYEIIPRSILKRIFMNDYKRMLSNIINQRVKIMRFKDRINRVSIEDSTTMNHVKRSFRSIYEELSEEMRIFTNGELKNGEHLKYFMEERLDRIELPASLFTNIISKDHSRTNKDKHEFRRRFIEISPKERCTNIYCTCGLSFIVNTHPIHLFVIPELKKNRKIKLLYPIKQGVTFRLVSDSFELGKPLSADCMIELNEKTI